MIRHRKLEDGEWASTRKLRNGTHVHKIKCCDCGLIHLMQYELTKRGSLRFRAWRENHKR